MRAVCQREALSWIEDVAWVAKSRSRTCVIYAIDDLSASLANRFVDAVAPRNACIRYILRSSGINDLRPASIAAHWC
jgi:hypothetical protein